MSKITKLKAVSRLMLQTRGESRSTHTLYAGGHMIVPTSVGAVIWIFREPLVFRKQWRFSENSKWQRTGSLGLGFWPKSLMPMELFWRGDDQQNCLVCFRLQKLIPKHWEPLRQQMRCKQMLWRGPKWTTKDQWNEKYIVDISSRQSKLNATIKVLKWQRIPLKDWPNNNNTTPQ